MCGGGGGGGGGQQKRDNEAARRAQEQENARRARENEARRAQEEEAARRAREEEARRQAAEQAYNRDKQRADQTWRSVISEQGQISSSQQRANDQRVQSTAQGNSNKINAATQRTAQMRGEEKLAAQNARSKGIDFTPTSGVKVKHKGKNQARSRAARGGSSTIKPMKNPLTISL